MRAISELVEAAQAGDSEAYDASARAALELILRTETDRRLWRQAHHALKRQDPNYKAAVDEKARGQGIAAARARREQQ